MARTDIGTDWVLERIDAIYPAYRVAMERLLVTLRRDFDGDLDAMLVLLTLSLGTDQADWKAALLAEAEPATQRRLTNTQSIADTTGIPRETVRRKLAAMAARGWVQRRDDGNWTPTRQAAADLRAGSAETVAFIAAVVAAALRARPRGGDGAEP
jgi:hypothetical protein